jgi:serine phosphatase RsbU (regulator of sigma subunit)
VRLALGGHPAPLILRAGGEVEAIGRPGTMLGADLGARLEDAEAELGAGDALVLYTDGVTECKTPTGRFGGERLMALLGRLPGNDAAAVTHAILDATVAAPGHSSSDDVAVLVLRALE